MVDWMLYLSTFIPLFVAFDPIGLLPIYLRLTEGMPRTERQKVLWQSIITATIVALLFTFIGKAIFNILRITVSDFQIAGGLILLILAIMDLIVGQKNESKIPDACGIVPIGVPLIVGPAVLTTIIIQVDLHGLTPTLFSLFINLLIIIIIFIQANLLLRILGKSGLKAISKIISLLLAAIGVMMIRVGILGVIESL